MADNGSLCSYDSLMKQHIHHLSVHYLDANLLSLCGFLHDSITCFCRKKSKKSRKVNFVRGCDALRKQTHAHTYCSSYKWNGEALARIVQKEFC